MVVRIYSQVDENISAFSKEIKKIFKGIKEKKSFNLIFVSKDEIKRLNNTFRSLNSPTDVLSFALCDDEDYNEKSPELGDIFICLEIAIQQATNYEHSVLREVCFLAVHGYLHLRGYDHLTKEDEEIMFNLQEKILEENGILR